nr:hypothetical protein [Tanacetum cinerariifolium]
MTVLIFLTCIAKLLYDESYKARLSSTVAGFYSTVLPLCSTLDVAEITLLIANENVDQNENGNGNVVATRAEGNGNGNNGNQAQLLIAQKEEAGIQLQAEEFDLMAATGDLDEIEEVNSNCILMANLQQVSTSGTKTDKALVHDSDISAKNENGNGNVVATRAEELDVEEMVKQEVGIAMLTMEEYMAHTR